MENIIVPHKTASTSLLLIYHRFLVDEQAVRSNKPELSWMLVWALVPPVTALSFFSQQYPAHPLTAQYAVRNMEVHTVPPPPKKSIVTW